MDCSRKRMSLLQKAEWKHFAQIICTRTAGRLISLSLSLKIAQELLWTKPGSRAATQKGIPAAIVVIFFKVSGYVLQGVKPQKPKVLGSDTLTAFKIENAKKRIFMDTYLCVNVYNICINVHKYSYTYVYLCIKKKSFHCYNQKQSRQ